MKEYRRAEKAALAVGFSIALSIHVVMNFLYFFGIVS